MYMYIKKINAVLAEIEDKDIRGCRPGVSFTT